MNGSSKICPQTGLSVSDVIRASPQSFNNDESSFSALSYVSWMELEKFPTSKNKKPEIQIW